MRAMGPGAVVVLLFTGGCGKSVQPLYNAAREAALADPGPPPADWSPDGILQISAPVVKEVLEAASSRQGSLSTRFALGPARVTPEIRLSSLQVVPSRRCEGCIGLDAAFSGTVAWTVGPLSGKAPVSARGAVDAVFEVRQEQKELVITAAPRGLRDLEVEIGELSATIRDLERSIRTLIETEGLSRVPPQPIARFPRGELPVRAARVLSDGQGIRIDLLTDVPRPGQAAAGPAPAEGFTASLAEATLLGLARAEAFRHGPVAYGVVPEPTSLSFTRSRFELGLRLWRLEGVGWWRDYTISGTAEIAGGKLTLAPKDVAGGEKSRGATLADPLAALAEGLILRAIEDAVNTSVPLPDVEELGGLPVTVALERIGAPEAEPETIRGRGTVRLGSR